MAGTAPEPVTPAATGTLRIVPAGEEHAEALAEFYRKTWDPEATAERVLEARRSAAEGNHAFPGESPPIVVALHGEAIVGYLGSLPVRFQVESRSIPGYWAKGLMVLPEYRNGPIGPLVVREASKRQPVLGSLAVNPPALRLFASNGLQTVGVLANRLLPIRAGNIVRRLDPALIPLERLRKPLGGLVRFATRPGLRPLAGAAAALGGRLLFEARSLQGLRGLDWDAGVELPEEADALWESISDRHRAGVVRDSSHLRWRYGTPAVDGYRYLTVRQRGDGALAGLGVIRAPKRQGDPRLQGIRVAVLSEVIADPSRPRVLRGLVLAAAAAADRMEADALLCSGTHPALLKALSRSGALALPPNVSFLVRLPEGTGVPALDAWWLTRGDGDADEVF